MSKSRNEKWIATLLRAGLLNGSFIPEKKIQDFRDLNRYRKSIIRDITSQKNRVEKFLQSAGFRLSSFVSDIFGASGRNIILHLIEYGQIDREALDSCLKTKTRNRADEILMSVNGTLSGHQQSFLKVLMGHYDSLKDHLAEVEAALGRDMEPFAQQVRQLSSIYGISTTASCAIIALARKLLVIIYTMLKQGTLFDESCFEARRKNCEQKQIFRYVRELQKHGYRVERQQ